MPVPTSCEWLTIINSIITSYYQQDNKKFRPRNHSFFKKNLELTSPISPQEESTFLEQRKDLFKKEKGGILSLNTRITD